MSVEVEAGSTILDAAIKGGVYVNSLCGGEGVCGKCRVIVQQGQVRGASTEFLTREEIRKGYVLACQGRVESDLAVEIPAESRLRQAVETADRVEDRFSQTYLRQRYDADLHPLVRKHYLELPPPSLENNIADLERLELALKKKMSGGEYQMGLKVTQRLPSVLREGNWNITATTAHRGSLSEIVNVEAGDTTRRNMGVAIDVGTTTVAAHLIDLTTAQTLGAAAKYNSQISYGSDVIRRIMYASSSTSGLRELQEAIVGDLNDLIGQLLAEHRLGFGDVTLVTVAGNTTMTHLLAGLSPEWIRKEPFIGVAYCPPPFRAVEVGLQVNPRGLLYFLPSVAAFVGADICAGVLATGMHKSNDTLMLLDIGTNGEVAIGNKEFIVCASTSAGPAFEGAESEAGMRATRGAIDHVKLFDPSRPASYSTVGSAPPIGVCGTGYIDLLAELLNVGLIDKTGRLQTNDSCDRIRVDDREVAEYVIVRSVEAGGDRDIVITQEDIANLLRAKGAIYAGARVVLTSLGMTFDDITEILVAGAFGNYLNLDNAITIGLLPDVPLEKLRFVGNTSITGAKLVALSHQKYEEAHEVASGMTYFELGTDPTFMDKFSSACFLPHTDIEQFPRVMARMQEQKMEGHA
jgi:uncharacterized 2Fe-2S/4Fe-4S cluster protein (DUF4445 family)